jgi:fatty acid desaturase
LPGSEIRRLSELRPSIAARAILAEWLAIAAAVAVGVWLTHTWSWVWVLFVPFLGARQHALAILAHDVAHFRLCADQRANDTLGNLLVAWPVFISVESFRHFHGLHHRFLAEQADGNRRIWHTHRADGTPTAEWSFPKTTAQLAVMVGRRAALLTGLFWILRGIIGGFYLTASWRSALARILYYGTAAAAITAVGGGGAFLRYWLVPYCTWHIAIQYVRLICEHSAVRSPVPGYGDTRTTIPGLLARVFVLPRHVGYHIEHHWYPSVPFYRLPELHERLMQEPGFREGAVVHRSLLASLRDCTPA